MNPDDVYDAMRTTTKALGGFIAVGNRMRPELSLKDAERWLSDALNRNRAMKLSPEQFLLLVRWGREAGCHALMNFVCDDTQYERTKPQVLAEQLAALQARAQTAALEAAQAASDLQTLMENPRLVAMIRAGNSKAADV